MPAHFRFAANSSSGDQSLSSVRCMSSSPLEAWYTSGLVLLLMSRSAIAAASEAIKGSGFQRRIRLRNESYLLAATSARARSRPYTAASWVHRQALRLIWSRCARGVLGGRAGLSSRRESILRLGSWVWRTWALLGSTAATPPSARRSSTRVQAADLAAPPAHAEGWAALCMSGQDGDMYRAEHAI